MGTTYNISCIGCDKNLKPGIDSLLDVVNQSMSTYMDSSSITLFNSHRDTTLFPCDRHVASVMMIALKVWKASSGAFDPTVMPLVEFWGFGKNKDVQPDSSKVDSLIALVGFDGVELTQTGNNGNYAVKKRKPNAQVDFSAVAKGYGVDAISVLLDVSGIEHYMIEIGGEVRTKGRNDKGQLWRIGIEKPVEQLQRSVFSALSLENEAMATSGNYRNFYEQDGQKYVHTINPKTGYPELSNTFSATVISNDCATADAFATAFMVLGVERGLVIAEATDDLEAYFIYSDSTGNFKTLMSSGLVNRVTEANRN